MSWFKWKKLKIVKTILDATDGSLQKVTFPAPSLSCLVSVKEIHDSIHSQSIEWSELFLEQSCEDEFLEESAWKHYGAHDQE